MSKIRIGDCFEAMLLLATSSVLMSPLALLSWHGVVVVLA
jgi:hypothetical protein